MDDKTIDAAEEKQRVEEGEQGDCRELDSSELEGISGGGSDVDKPIETPEI